MQKTLSSPIVFVIVVETFNVTSCDVTLVKKRFCVVVDVRLHLLSRLLLDDVDDRLLLTRRTSIPSRRLRAARVVGVEEHQQAGQHVLVLKEHVT